MRRAAKVDTNHAEIRSAFRSMGFAVYDASKVGGGLPDLLISRNEKTKLVEVKTATGKFTKAQIEFRDGWKDTILVARCLADVEAISKGWLNE